VVGFASTIFMVPRPVILSYALLAATVVVLRRPDRLGWVLVPMVWVWAGLHASYSLGLALIILEAVRTKSWRLFGIGVGAGVTTAFTAHGLGSWEFLLSFLESREALSFISEWATPDFTQMFLAPFLLLVVGLVAAGLTGRITPRDLVVIVPFLLLGLTQQRSVLPAIIVLAPFAAGALVPRKEPSPASAGNAAGNGVLLAGLALLAITPFVRNDTSLRTDVMPPLEAVAALEQGRAFHGAATGGLLIYSEWPDRLVYVDDRAELYGVEGFQEFVDVRNGDDYQRVFEREGINQAIVKADWGITAELESDGWSVTYADDDWIVYVRG